MNPFVYRWKPCFTNSDQSGIAKMPKAKIKAVKRSMTKTLFAQWNEQRGNSTVGSLINVHLFLKFFSKNQKTYIEFIDILDTIRYLQTFHHNFGCIWHMA